MEQSLNYEQLESVICKLGSAIAEKISPNEKNEIDKALGVLSSDGVYAYYVYVISKKIDNVFLDEITDLMNYTDTKLSKNNYKDYFIKLSNNINDLLFFKEILEQTLIFARYHAKAREKNE